MVTKNPKLRIFGWAFYDFANTIFSAVVLTAYFPLYLTRIAGKNVYLGAATTGAMILAGLVIPVLGSLSDRTGKTKRYLIRTTLLTILFLSCFVLSRSPLVLVLLFFVACFFYHASLVFYNALLPVSAPPHRQGFASGLGTGLGYLGVVTTLPLAHFVESRWGTPPVFPFTGFLFLAFALPLFLFVPERTVKNPVPFRREIWKNEWKNIFQTVRRIWHEPATLLFFGGNFFVVDALNTMIFWFLVYVREVFQPPQSHLIGLLMGVNAAAFVYGILSGFLTDRFGALKTMILAGLSLTITFI